MRKMFYQYTDMIGDIHRINRGISLSGWKPNYIMGITRGGLIPAIHMSHWWEVPLIVCNKTTRDNKIGNDNNNDWVKTVNNLINGINDINILVVDDICDSGETFDVIKTEILKESHINDVQNYLRFASLIYNESGKEFVPDWYGTTINKMENPVWIVYPWETN